MKERFINLWKIFKHLLQQKRAKRIFYIVIVTFSLVFIGFVIMSNWAQLKSQEWHIEIIFIIIAIVSYPIGMFPTIAAWHWLLKALNANKPFLLNMRLYALSSLPRHIPGLVWYVASRTLLYEEYGIGTGTVIASTALETGLLALSGFVTAILIIPLQTKLPPQVNAIRYLILISVFILVLFFIFAPRGSILLDKLLRYLQKDREKILVNRSRFWISLIWMFIAWVGGGILLWILVRAITPIGIHFIPLMAGIWGLAGAISLTIGIGIQGLGLREVTLGALLSMVISPIEAITAAIAFRLVLTIGELLWVFLISILLTDKTIGIVRRTI